MSHSTLLFILGVAGIIFYALAPIFFPHVPDLRQPELLPVYSLMIGLGGLLRQNPDIKVEAKPHEEDKTSNHTKKL